MERKWQTQRSVCKEYKDALALQASIREELIGDNEEAYRKTHLTDSLLKDAEAALLELNGRLSLREVSRLALDSSASK